MPPKTRKPPSAVEQAKDDRPAAARETVLPPFSFPLGSETYAPTDNCRALQPSQRPRTAMAPIVNGNHSGSAVEPRAQNAIGRIEESLGVLKEELQAHKQTSDNMKSDLSHARSRIIALEEELQDLRDRERRQRLDSVVKIDDLSLQLTK